MHLTANNLQLINELVNKNGFKFHHSKGTDASLYKWIKKDKKDIVPHYSLHVVSCGGIIIKDSHALLVREKSVLPNQFRDFKKGTMGFQEEELTRMRGFRVVPKEKSEKRLDFKAHFEGFYGLENFPVMFTTHLTYTLPV